MEKKPGRSKRSSILALGKKREKFLREQRQINLKPPDCCWLPTRFGNYLGQRASMSQQMVGFFSVCSSYHINIQVQKKKSKN